MRLRENSQFLLQPPAKNIKLAEAIVLAVLFGSIAADLDGMCFSLALGIAMLILAGIALVGFMTVRVWRWWMHGWKEGLKCQ